MCARRRGWRMRWPCSCIDLLQSLPAGIRGDIEKLHDTGTVLAGKTVLVVDDDIRNIFAMTSILEPYNINVVSAEIPGGRAIDILQTRPDIDIVLMDIMMPQMDGFDTMRAIRKVSKFRSLPIIALTAKAMKGDREKCIEAGASDYISNPVDTGQLLALLRVWLLPVGLRENSAWSDASTVNILIVDDRPDKLMALEAVLEELGENIVCVDSGREALRQLLESMSSR